MTKDIIRMAREAGLFAHKEVQPELIAFAALVAAHAMAQPCCGNFATCQQACMPKGAAVEREACAKLCLEIEPFYGVMFAAAIRERGTK